VHQRRPCTRAESILFDSYIELPTQPCEVPEFPKIHSLQNYFPRFRRVDDLFVTGRVAAGDEMPDENANESVRAVIIIRQAFPRDPTIQLTRPYLSSTTKRWERQHARDNASCATCILINCSKPRLMILCNETGPAFHPATSQYNVRELINTSRNTSASKRCKSLSAIDRILGFALSDRARFSQFCLLRPTVAENKLDRFAFRRCLPCRLTNNNFRALRTAAIILSCSCITARCDLYRWCSQRAYISRRRVCVTLRHVTPR